MENSDTEQTSKHSPTSVNDAIIAGYLNKQFPRNWWRFCGSWKRRYCSLNGNKLYFKESQSNSGHEKTSGIINLEHFDVCEQLVKDTKNCANIFVIYSTVQCNAGLFDLKHTFAANSKEEMNKWIESVRQAIKDSKLGRKTDSTRRKSDKSELSTTKNDNHIEVNLNGLTADETLMNATKSRPKGPKGRRPPLRKSMQPQSSARMNGNHRKARANSLGFVSENIEESDENSANSDTRKSRSLHSVDDQEIFENTCDEEDDTKQSSDSERFNFTRMQHRKEATPNTQMNKNKQISPLIQELQQRYAIPQINAKVVRRSESDRSSFGLEESRNSDSHRGVNKNVKDMSSFLGELKSNITEIEIEMFSLKKEMNKMREKINEHDSDDLEMKVKEKLHAIDRMYSEAYTAMQEAKKAEDTYKMLSNECRILLKQLKSLKETTSRTRSTPEYIDQIDNDSIGYI